MVLFSSRLRRVPVSLPSCRWRGPVHVSGAVAVDGDTFAVGLVGEPVDIFHVFKGGGIGEVHGFADGIVGIQLEGGLHADMILPG